MTNPKEIKPLDLMEQIKEGMDEEDMLALLQRRKNDRAQLQRQKPTIVHKIENFDDTRVDPTSPHCIFSVYNKESGTEALFKGDNLQKFLNLDKNIKDKFLVKKLPQRFDVGVYTLTFQYFNLLSK